MAWDFSTEPEFEEKLAWMRTFVRDEIFPLETLDLDHETFLNVVKPLQEQVKERGLWASHLPPELGGGGPARTMSAPTCMCEVAVSCARNDASRPVRRFRCSCAIARPYPRGRSGGPLAACER